MKYQQVLYLFQTGYIISLFNNRRPVIIGAVNTVYTGRTIIIIGYRCCKIIDNQLPLRAMGSELFPAIIDNGCFVGRWIAGNRALKAKTLKNGVALFYRFCHFKYMKFDLPNILKPVRMLCTRYSSSVKYSQIKYCFQSPVSYFTS